MTHFKQSNILNSLRWYYILTHFKQSNVLNSLRWYYILTHFKQSNILNSLRWYYMLTHFKQSNILNSLLWYYMLTHFKQSNILNSLLWYYILSIFRHTHNGTTYITMLNLLYLKEFKEFKHSFVTDTFLFWWNWFELHCLKSYPVIMKPLIKLLFCPTWNFANTKNILSPDMSLGENKLRHSSESIPNKS